MLFTTVVMRETSFQSAYVFLDLYTGELYVQAQRMFDDSMYTRLLAIIDLAVKQAIVTTDNFESEFVSRTFALNPFPCYYVFFCFGLDS